MSLHGLALHKRLRKGYSRTMKTISTSELRSRIRPLVRALEKGQAVGLVYRGQRLANILPVRQANSISANDPLYQFHHHAEVQAKPLDDREIDSLVYGR